MGDSDAIIKRLNAEGWQRVSVTGSQWTFEHPGFSALITVPHPRKDLAKGLKRAIYKAAGW
jgi:predicted RNA binding protein YcfA (HicA-like mRNA interferase family)